MGTRRQRPSQARAPGRPNPQEGHRKPHLSLDPARCSIVATLARASYGAGLIGGRRIRHERKIPECFTGQAAQCIRLSNSRLRRHWMMKVAGRQAIGLAGIFAWRPKTRVLADDAKEFRPAGGCPRVAPRARRWQAPKKHDALWPERNTESAPTRGKAPCDLPDWRPTGRVRASAMSRRLEKAEANLAARTTELAEARAATEQERARWS